MPLGGYVKLLGESPDEEMPKKIKNDHFTNKTPFQRFLIVFAGPFFNLIFATVIIYFALIIQRLRISAFAGLVMWNERLSCS